MEHPRAFISHSSKDKAIVLRLGEDLLKNGIDAWVDKWEIRPGDSFVEKINEGIKGCKFFLIIISENSVSSNWVRDELNAGIIRKINQESVLIPIRLDRSEVPELLRHLHYIELNDYESGLQSLLDVFFGRSNKPPLGEPAQLLDQERNDFGLSPEALDIAEWLVKQDKEGLIWRAYNQEILTNALNIPGVELEDALEELDSQGLIKYTRYGSGNGSIFTKEGLPLAIPDRIQPSLLLDMLKVSRVLVKADRRLEPITLLEETGFEIPRLNRAVLCLKHQGMAEVASPMSTAPYAFIRAVSTRLGRKFVKDNEQVAINEEI